MPFFSLPKIISFFVSIFYRKNCENRRFCPPKTLPKSMQKAFEIDVPTNMRFFSDVCLKKPLPQERRPLIFAGRAIVLLAFHTFLHFAFGMHFRFKKPTKNPSKTRSEPLKNRCQKRIVFQHRFFRVSAWILEGLGPPRWSQVGQKGPAKLLGQPFLTLLS